MTGATTENGGAVASAARIGLRSGWTYNAGADHAPGPDAKRLSALIALSLALTGCATTRYSTVYCLGHDQQLPAEPPKIKDKLTGQADTDIGIIAGSAIRLRAWGEGLQNIIEGCREPAR